MVARGALCLAMMLMAPLTSHAAPRRLCSRRRRRCRQAAPVWQASGKARKKCRNRSARDARCLRACAGLRHANAAMNLSILPYTPLLLPTVAFDAFAARSRQERYAMPPLDIAIHRSGTATRDTCLSAPRCFGAYAAVTLRLPSSSRRFSLMSAAPYFHPHPDRRHNRLRAHAFTRRVVTAVYCYRQVAVSPATLQRLLRLLF